MAFKLDPVLVSSQQASKATEAGLLSLLKHNGIGDYIYLAPVLFENLDSMDADGFMKNPILVKIVHVMIYSNLSLSQVKQGHPKARGEHSGVHSITEGLVATAAIMACFLLTSNPALTETGAITCIPYRADYDFYLKWLFKRSCWANEVMDLFNCKIFGQESHSTAPGSDLASFGGIAVPSHSWKDDLLKQMDNSTQVSKSKYYIQICWCYCQ
ncbi:hypothetical protein HD554DRAFT_2041845 [Boletus coccyginus]|nr:hypothetical protein HD554DRAFT_2041845 [Boletus coccyginus]